MAYETHNTYVAPPSNLDMASPEWADYMQRVRANQAAGAALSARNAAKRDGGITKWLPRLAWGVIGGATGAGALGAMGGGAAATSAAPAAAPSFGLGATNTGAWTAGVGAAPGVVSAAAAPTVAGGGMTFGNLLKAAQVGVPAVTGLIGMRSQNKALDRQSALEQQNLSEQMTMAREQEAYRRQEAERVAAEEARRWQAEEAFRAKQWEAQERDRVELEARRAPRREASQRALLRLQDLLRLGRG